MASALYLKLRFIPPQPISEQEFNIAKQLQSTGSRKITYLNMPNGTKQLIKFLSYFYLGLISTWLILLFINTYFPDIDIIVLKKDVEYIVGFALFALMYILYQLSWEYLTCRIFNQKLHLFIKKSNTYSDFRKIYFSKYGK